MGKHRVEWVDIAKGVGILLVITGHCVYLGGFIHNWIFAFHMPLFFLLSGLFFKEDTFVNLFKKKFKQLILPYIWFCLLGAVLSLAIPQWRALSFKLIFWDLYLGYPNSVNVSSIWFLVCLFITTLMLNVIVAVRKRNEKIAGVMFLMIVCFGFMLGRFPAILARFPRGRLPLDGDCACVALLFLGMGYGFKNRILKTVALLQDNSIICQWLGLIVSFAIISMIVILNGTVNLHGLTYHNEFLFIIGALAGFAFIIFLSILVLRNSAMTACISWFGANSLKIMGVQAILIRIYLLVVNEVTAQSYNIYFLPTGHTVLSTFVVLFGSGVAVTIYNCIYRRMIKML